MDDRRLRAVQAEHRAGVTSMRCGILPVVVEGLLEGARGVKASISTRVSPKST